LVIGSDPGPFRFTDLGNLVTQATAVPLSPTVTLMPPVPTPAPVTPTAPVALASGWSCGAKTMCGQMSSCDEAKFYLSQCGVNRLDGDGIPCAALCR